MTLGGIFIFGHSFSFSTISYQIEKHIKKGYTDIAFMDDSKKNIDAVNRLKSKYPNVRIKTKWITEHIVEEIQECVQKYINKIIH